MRPASITIRERDAAVQLKMAEAKERLDKVDIEKEKVKVEKLNTLKGLLTATIEDETSIAGGFEQKLKAVFDDSEQQTIKDKIFDIVNKL
jgi:hypothetical protein